MVASRLSLLHPTGVCGLFCPSLCFSVWIQVGDVLEFISYQMQMRPLHNRMIRQYLCYGCRYIFYTQHSEFICDPFLSYCVRVSQFLYLFVLLGLCVLCLWDCWLWLGSGGIGNSPQTSQHPCGKHSISHHWLQCEIGLAADFTPRFYPGSLEQIVIRDNWLALKRSCMLSTFNFHLTPRWKPICMLCLCSLLRGC